MRVLSVTTFIRLSLSQRKKDYSTEDLIRAIHVPTFANNMRTSLTQDTMRKKAAYAYYLPAHHGQQSLPPHDFPLSIGLGIICLILKFRGPH